MSVELSERDGSLDAQIAATDEALLATTGCRTSDAAVSVLTDAMNLLSKGKPERRQPRANQFLAMMSELAPQDGFEGMLISQMLVTHSKAIECFQRADKTDSVQVHFGAQNQGVRLMRLFNQQLPWTSTAGKATRRWPSNMSISIRAAKWLSAT